MPLESALVAVLRPGGVEKPDNYHYSITVWKTSVDKCGDLDNYRGTVLQVTIELPGVWKAG